MIYKLDNGILKVELNSRGARLWSVQDRDGHEYLWQGDRKYWAEKSLNLFPYIARMTEQSYECMGKRYHMDIHGFIKDMDLHRKAESAEGVCFYTEDTDFTRKYYPYAFHYEVSYRLKEAELMITYRVRNLDQKPMYFGIGGHPGFCVPMEEEKTFEDYYLEFGGASQPFRVGFSEDCFVEGPEIPFELIQGKMLPLTHKLFDDDAIVLHHMYRSVTLKTENGKRALRVAYPDMDYLGLWHMPHTEAPYICIEPWSSLPSRKGIIEEISRQTDLITLEPGQVYENQWSIEVL